MDRGLTLVVEGGQRGAWRPVAAVTSRRDLGLGEVLGLRSGFDPPDLDRPAGPGPGPALSTRRVGNPW